jgi:transposase-like protein
MAKQRFTFKQFQTRFPDDDACLLEIFKRRYGTESEACPHCGVIGKLSKIGGRRAYACQEGCHIYPCAGTVFEKSPTNLTKWFHAMYLFTSTRNGVSAKRIEREIGVTYKCAWRIGHQLRQLLAARDAADNPGPLSGHVEMDEVYIGGRLRKHKGYGKGFYLKNKSTVFGMVERGGVLRSQVVPSERHEVLMPIIVNSVTPGTTVSTDRSRSYLRLKRHGYKHDRVNHDIGEYVRGDVHTNTIEGFWSHLKRGIKSTHASVSKKHIQKYVDEFVFRYNNRDEPAEMFNRVLKQISKPVEK